MTQFPEISPEELNKMRKRINVVGRDNEGRLRYLKFDAIELRKTDIVNNPVFGALAGELRLYRQVAINLPLLFSAVQVRATVAEIFMQLTLLRQAGAIDNGIYGSVHAVELCADACTREPSKNRIVVPVLLYR